MTTSGEATRLFVWQNSAIQGLAVVSLLSLVLTIYNYFNPNNGIHGTAGALLVIVSTALMLVASVVIAVRWARPRWVRILLEVLILLDIFGTGFAGYMLESWILLVLMAIALIGWIVHVAAPARRKAAAPEILQ
jgi:hypothetical protein